MIKKINEKKELISLELELLQTCLSDLGFFQRLVSKTIPLIRNVFHDIVQTWEIELLTDNKINKANNELTTAFIALIEIAKKRRDLSLKEQLIVLLRLIRGPRFEFGNSLIRRAYPRLKELYIFHVGILEKFPFAAMAQKVTEFQQWEKYHKNWYTFVYSNASQIDWDAPPKKIIVFVHYKKNVHHKKCNKVALKIICARKKTPKSYRCTFVYYAYQQMFKELEQLFAPTATELYLQLQDQFIADQQCSAKLIWISLQTLEECWPLRNKRIFAERWPRIRGKVEEIGLIAHATYNRFLLIAAAEELRFLDKPNSKQFIFKREDYMVLVRRLSLEIQRASILPENELGKKISSSDLRSPKVDSDEGVFCDWYASWLDKNKNINAHERTIERAIAHFKKSSVKLCKKYEDSTYKTWVIKFRKRKKAQLGKTISLFPK